MNKLTLLLAVAVIPLIGCVPSAQDKQGTSFCDGGCEEPNNNEPLNNVYTPPDDRPQLKGTFISGHLGSYWDCPEQAYMEPTPAGSDGDGGISSDGACAEGSECPTFTSCESAQITISLSNGGDSVGEGILVDQIELFGTDGISRAVLPLESTVDTATNEAFDGELEVGEEVVLRIEFQGPYNSWELLQPIDDGDSTGDRAAGGGGIVETTFSSDNHADLTVESGEIYDVPAVDT